jgi:hypothetical protein
METASGESGTSSEMEDSMSMDVARAQFQLNNYNTGQESPEVYLAGFLHESVQ